MGSEVIVILTAIITTTISALISGIFELVKNKIQAQLAKQSFAETPKILLPPGVELRKPANEPKKRLPSFTDFVGGGLIFGIIIGIILQNYQPTKNSPSNDIWVNLTYLMAAFVIIGIVALGSVLRKYQKLGNRLWSITIAISLTLIVVLFTSYFVLSAFFEERTVYFLVDMSSNSKDILKETLARLNLEIGQVSDNVDVGLAVFGGNLGEGSDCHDITEIVSPAPKQTSMPQINLSIASLSNVTPSGVSPLQNAVVYVLTRLSSRKGIQQIIVLTASPDSVCGILDRQFLDSIAVQSDTKFELTVVAIGDISDADSENLTAYADRFKKIETAEDLSAVIQDVLYTPPTLYEINK